MGIGCWLGKREGGVRNLHGNLQLPKGEIQTAIVGIMSLGIVILVVVGFKFWKILVRRSLLDKSHVANVRNTIVISAKGEEIKGTGNDISGLNKQGNKQGSGGPSKRNGPGISIGYAYNNAPVRCSSFNKNIQGASSSRQAATEQEHVVVLGGMANAVENRIVISKGDQ